MILSLMKRCSTFTIGGCFIPMSLPKESYPLEVDDSASSAEENLEMVLYASHHLDQILSDHLCAH